MLKDKKLFLFDIDGVIKLGDEFIDGSKELFKYIDSVGGKSVFITNNSTKSNIEYAEYFRQRGFDVDESNFVTALSVTEKYLLQHFKSDLIFVVGTKAFENALKLKGLRITETADDDVKVVLVAFDTELNYSKLQNACKLLQTKDVTYLATNSDLRCPVEYGFIPDCGSIVDMIYSTTGCKPTFLGKPAPDMVFESLTATGFTKAETVVVGDRLYTDIACGINANVDTIAVLTGEIKQGDILNTKFKPTYVFNSVKEIYEELTK